MIASVARGLALLAMLLPHPAHKHKPKKRHRPVPMQAAVASEYGGPDDNQLGNPLACGGTFEQGTRGVANKTLPCGTRLRLCFRRCVTARVIDRGPYIAGREFDLTAQTAADIGAPYPDVMTIRWRFAH